MNSETTSGKACIIFENNKFSCKYVGRRFSTWKCTTRQCNASIRTDEAGKIQETTVVHNHEVKVTNVASYRLKVACKRKAMSDNKTRPSKVVLSELQQLGEDGANVSAKDIKLAKRCLWKSRVKK